MRINNLGAGFLRFVHTHMSTAIKVVLGSN
jgi:hypothetical protein